MSSKKTVNGVRTKIRAIAGGVGGFFRKYWKLFAITAGVLLAAGAASYAFIPAPKAEGALKGHTVDLHRNGQISIIFDTRMDHASVERSFSINPAMTGSFGWQDNQMTFKPTTDFEKGKRYEVTITEDARSFWYKRLEEPYRQTFNILDYPEVTVVAPSNGSEINQSQTLTVLFDHPLRKLTQENTAPALVKLEPSVEGTFRWLGTSGFEFVPKDVWPAATEFTATVPKGTKTADGGSTIEDYVWKFRTSNLALDTINQGRHALAEPITLYFNYAVDPQAIKNAILIVEDTRGEGDFLTPIGPNDNPPNSVVKYSFETSKDDPKNILVRRNGGFELGKSYHLVLRAGFNAGLGSLGLVNDWSAIIETDELNFKVKATDPEDNGTKEPYSSVVVCFNNPLDEDLLQKSVTVTPAIEGMQITPYGWSSKCDGGEKRSLTINGSWKASTKYTVKITGSMKDIYGQALGQDLKFAFTTNPYRPRAELSTYSLYGVLAAHLPRIYQLRTMNLSQPITASLCSGTFEEYLGDAEYKCATKEQQTINPENKQNEYKILDIDLDTFGSGKLANGYYQFNLDIPGLDSAYGRSQKRILVVSDTSLTLKRDRDGKLLVWATDMKTGNVVGNMRIEAFRGKDTKAVATGKTDKDGIAILKLDSSSINESLTVRATDGNRLGLASTDWSDGIAPWNFGMEANWRQSTDFNIGYIYTDRRIYRPDQLVYFKGIVRRDMDAKLSIPELKEVSVTIEDQEGKQVFSQNLPLSAYGTFNGLLQLQSNMALGTYRVFTQIAGSADDAPRIEGYFDVREYRRPDFKVELQLPEGAQTAGQELKLPIHAEYYHGLALKKAKVTYEISRTKLYFQPNYGDWYNFGMDEDYDCYWYCRTENNLESIQSGEGVLDDSGNLTITVPANLTDYKSSATYSVTVTVTDASQRSVSYNADVAVHKGDLYLGIRTDYTSGWDSPNADFDIVSLNTDATPRANVAATVKFARRTWANVKKIGADGVATWEYDHTDVAIETKTVTTDNNGKAQVSFSPQGDGEYVAIVQTRDKNGNTVSATAYRYIYRGSVSGVRISDDHVMRIVQNKASYEVGDNASLAVQTPYTKTKALLTMERNTIREYRVIDLGTDARTVDLKIKDDAAPNLFVSVIAVKGGGETGVPEFRMGYANLQVNTSKKMLKVTVTPDKATYRPGEQVTLDVVALNSDGSPAQAELSLEAVDERVIALLGSIDKNVLGKFWFPRNIGVFTSQTLTQLVRKVFFATEGGAGGKGGGETPTVRGNFQDTAYWKADAVTGADGKVRLTFKLPDNLTSWQILAIGTTKDTVVGSTEAKIVTRRDLMAEPLLPRILRYDDVVTLGATISNSTDQTVNAQVDIQAGGISIDGTSARTVSVAPKSSAVVRWTARVPHKGNKAEITVIAKGNGYEDGFVMGLPILPYAVPEIISTSGILERNVTEALELPEGALPDAGELKVSVEPGVGNGLQGGLDYLVQYPYGCSEQRTSAMLGNLMFAELADMKVTKATDEQLAQSKKNIEEAIRTVLPIQRGDGGYNYWIESVSSYPHLTAYVLWGQIQATKAGYSVDPAAMDRADEYLRDQLAHTYENGYSYQGLQDSERAQVLFMLSERNPEGLSGYAASLYERRASLSSFGKAFLAMAYGNIEKNSSSGKAATLLGEVRNKLVLLNPSTAYVSEDEGYDEYMSSDNRSTSIYLQALLRLDPKNEDVERLVRYLMQNRKDGYWESTQSTAMSLLGLVDYVRANPIDERMAQVSLFLNNKLSETLKFPQGDVSGAQIKTVAMSDLTKSGANQQIGLEKDSDKRYFYDITLKSYKDIADIEPFENGFSIVSDVYALDDKKFERPLTQVQQGQNVKVRVKLLVPKSHRYVALESNLPSGLEAIDFQLKTSPQNLAGQERECAPSYWGDEPYCFSPGSSEYSWWWENVWKHIEYRDDRVFLFADTLEPGVYEYEYLAQAVTPGEFRIPPTQVYEFYNPSANAHNEGKKLTITAK